MPPVPVASRVRRLSRRAVALAAVALALLLVVVVLQVRAERLQDQQDQQEAAATRLALEREAEQAAAETAEREAEAARAAADAAAWADATAAASAKVAEADTVLAGSAAAVHDDAVRQTLAAAIEAVRALIAGPPAPELLGESTAVMAAAGAAVVHAQAIWQAEQEGLAAQAAAEAAAAQAETETRAAPPAPAPDTAGAGAGPDCGGPGSAEPPKNDGSPVFYTSTPSSSGDGSNGRVPASAMSALGWCTDSQGNAQWLRSDAAAALTRLNEAFRAQFRENVAVDMSYRSYEDQVAMREHYGSLAARPGTSNHGLGLAIDTWEWQAYAFGSARYDWLVANGPAYGWVAPAWARQSGSNPEYWHFEYVG